jgi:hypothetical protein
MGKVQKIIIAAFIIAALIYIFVQAVVFVGSGVLAFVTDAEGQMLGYLHNGVNIVPQGIVSKVKINYIPLNGSCDVDILIPVPPLELIKSDHYSIKIPVAVNYTLDAKRLTLVVQKLYADSQYMPLQLQKRLLDKITENLKKYLLPYYQYNLLQANIQKELVLAIAHVKESCAKDGILINEVITGTIYIPDYAVYIEGRKFLNELLQQEKANTLRLNAVQQKLKENEINNTQYLEYLEKMSKIIAKNKDILKYIYIDKLADNVKVIVTSDRNVPLDLANESESESLKKDFDNFKK